MSAPLPRGFVLFHAAFNQKPFLAPADRVFVWCNTKSGLARVAVIGEHCDDDDDNGRDVVESFAEVQAALVRALGAQEPAQ